LGGGDFLVYHAGCVERLFSQVTVVGIVQQLITGRYLPMIPVQEKKRQNAHSMCQLEAQPLWCHRRPRDNTQLMVCATLNHFVAA
jgi:hypothetical protein